MAPVIPHFPDDARLSGPEMPQRLLPGLEESSGALYEIGVADDGTIVGLAEDEMEESLNNLRAMAASLGCGVKVMRRVPVGDCEWTEDSGTAKQRVVKSQLLVAEALVRPEQHLIDHTKSNEQDASDMPSDASVSNMGAPASESPRVTEQMRVSVTGATMSGKSSLLGTLSTATLDNGRGKSRLSLLKHRHEIASGMTSSVTQDQRKPVDLCFSLTQLVILDLDAPQSVESLAADNTDESSGKLGASPSAEEILGPAAADLDLSHAHLQLCLALELPLVIVITKFDLATRTGLGNICNKLFSVLKKHKKTPCLISDAATSVLEADLHTIDGGDPKIDNALSLLADSPLAAVPIILTSAVKGTGIRKLHAFLRELPMPKEVTLPAPAAASPLFHIEDVYSVRTDTSNHRSAIIGGYLRYGSLAVGDELLLGPYPVDVSSDDSDSGSAIPNRKPSIPQSRSFPGALNTKSKNASLRDRHSEWRRVRITSLRNLRLPVRKLHTGQVGTMGLAPVDTPIVSPSINRIRKGMVLAAREPKAHKVITVRFEEGQAEGVKDLGVGSAVVVYIASVRASSKVLSVSAERTEAPALNINGDDDAFGFGFDDEVEKSATEGAVIVTFQFIASREFVEMGAKVLVMPGGGPGLFGGNERGAKGMAGLEGFVGRVVDDA
ncbi:uncharacterized protein J4E78_002573 [Alternaria triticimaculans]|uniref:uncharacterized protein n=1 Tax=Alternaria triticimaculans TaxID=297637 RepID=UPI0020C3ADCF|nr:uncharacterized protein J4E78_002573 [Alternaria triticimaculans]KAI4668745.1 hypothetical protein J4E78_002573 [Alternaria triticimaculans]